MVITGGSAGIGRTFAHRFAAEGASIVVADLAADVGQKVVEQLEAVGSDCLSFRMDVRDTDAATDMAAGSLSDSVASTSSWTTPAFTSTKPSCPTRSKRCRCGKRSWTSM